MASRIRWWRHRRFRGHSTARSEQLPSQESSGEGASADQVFVGPPQPPENRRIIAENDNVFQTCEQIPCGCVVSSLSALVCLRLAETLPGHQVQHKTQGGEDGNEICSGAPASLRRQVFCKEAVRGSRGDHEEDFFVQHETK